jgi:hypothetical protein
MVHVMLNVAKYRDTGQNETLRAAQGDMAPCIAGFGITYLPDRSYGSVWTCGYATIFGSAVMSAQLYMRAVATIN